MTYKREQKSKFYKNIKNVFKHQNKTLINTVINKKFEILFLFYILKDFLCKEFLKTWMNAQGHTTIYTLIGHDFPFCSCKLLL